MKIKKIFTYFRINNILQKASDAWQKGELKLAKELYGDVLKIESYNYEATFWRGVLLLRNSEFEEAKLFLKKASLLKKSDYRPDLYLAHIYQDEKEFDKALLKYEEVLRKLNPGVVSRSEEYFTVQLEVNYNMGFIFFFKGEFGKTMDYANRALRFDPNFGPAEKLKMAAYENYNKN